MKHLAHLAPNDPEHLQTLSHLCVFRQQRFKCTDRCTYTDLHHHTDKLTLTTELTGNGIPTRKAIKGAMSACGWNSVSYLTFNTQSTRNTMQGWKTVHTSHVKVFLTVHVTCHCVRFSLFMSHVTMFEEYQEKHEVIRPESMLNFCQLHGRREEGRVDTGRISGSAQRMLSNIQT